jgi:hypothetical protein
MATEIRMVTQFVAGDVNSHVTDWGDALNDAGEFGPHPPEMGGSCPTVCETPCTTVS